jgi:flagellar hook assembly protein FlgD
VTASDLEATNAKFDNLVAGNTTATSLRATSFIGQNGTLSYLNVSGTLLFKSQNVTYKTVVIDGVTYHLMGY